MIIPVPRETVVHRIGGASIENLRLAKHEILLAPPGISLLIGGTPEQAVADMRRVYPRSPKWRGELEVASATVAAIRIAGFDVLFWPTPSFDNHARLIHPKGVDGFTDSNLALLASAFQTTEGG